ncbi:hypothetical protein quinque_008947 [Culex quinquefasciatus]
MSVGNSDKDHLCRDTAIIIVVIPQHFDSKTSPLALLAQTCSAIGSDSPNPKLLANIEKSTKGSRDKLSPGTLSSGSSNDTPKSSFKPYESTSSVVHDLAKSQPEDGRHQPIASNKSPKHPNTSMAQPPTNGRCESNQSATSSRASPSLAHSSRRTPSGAKERHSSPNRTPSKESPNSAHNDMATEYASTSKAENATRSTTSSESLPKPATSTVPTSVSIGPPYYSPYGSFPMDVMTASALMSPHHQMLKAATMNSYYNYSKMKAADSLMPVCRDPYCTGCALSSHMLGKVGSSGCPAGCTQCDHPGSKNYQSSAAAAASLAASQSSAAMYAHAQLAALAAASQLPYVCNWIGSDSSYCGKRFAASDELFQHLRTQHAAAASMSEALLNPATAAAAAASLPPTHPLFQRTYPTPPLSPLSSARYHPYGKPSLPLPPSMAGLPMPHPSLAQYFSPYAFYGARLNGSNNMHP